MSKNNASELYGLAPTVRYRPVGEEGVLVHLDSGRVIVVNGMALNIINSLKQAPKTANGLVAEIIEDYDVQAPQAESDVMSFLDELKKEDVLVVSSHG